MHQRIAVVVVHMLDDARFLGCGKRIRNHEFAGLDPVNLAESADEPDTNEIEPEKLEIMSLGVLARRRKVSEVSLADILLFLVERPRVGNARDTASRLYVIVAVVVEHRQRHS